MTTTTTTPPWLDAYALRTGQDPTLLGTRAVPRHCRGCGLSVLTGYDAPICAGLAIVDPYRASWQEEAAAVLLGRPTYRLWGNPSRYELHLRHHPLVEPIGVQAPADQIVVLIAHRCGIPHLATGLVPHYRPPSATTDGPPPY